MKGDHGQHGEDGRQGPPGPAGRDGVAGLTGSSPYLGKNKTLVLFLFVVLAFVVLSYRTEANDRQITRNQVESCEEILAVRVKINEQQRANTLIEQTNPFIDETVRAARIRSYGEAMLPLPDCSRLR